MTAEKIGREIKGNKGGWVTIRHTGCLKRKPFLANMWNVDLVSTEDGISVLYFIRVRHGAQNRGGVPDTGNIEGGIRDENSLAGSGC